MSSELSTPPDPDPVKILSNLTPRRLRIPGNAESVLEFAPLEKNREMKESDLQAFKYRNFELRNQIKVKDKEEKKDAGSKFAEVLPGAGTVIFFVFIMGHAFTKENPTANFWFWIIGVIVTAIVGLGILLVLSFGSMVARRLVAQSLSLVLILGFGIALPGLVIFNFNGGRELIANKTSLVLLGRALQLVFIVAASLLPALLYFLFDRQQLGTLRDRFEQQIFRLDPNVETLVDVNAKYGRQLSEVYGSESETGQGRLIRTTRWPIVMATVVITLGWLLVFLPTDRTLVINQASDLSKLFLPQPTGANFAFLGAYFFALNTSLLRYTRADLKPKAYSSITVRIFLVMILAWVIGSFPYGGSPYGLVAVFLVGIFPESGMTLIREYVTAKSLSWKSTSLAKEEYALTNLQDIDVYDRARLADEGVTNIEGLAHHDLVDLMLETRIPVPRLVDWVDQAILYLHLVAEDDGDVPDAEEQKKEAKAPGSDKVRSGVLRQCLREYGVRTATDFIVAWKKGNGNLPKTLHENAKDSFNRLQVLFDIIQDDEWLNYIQHWREHSTVEEDPAPKDKKSETSEDAGEKATVAVISVASQGSNGQE